MIYALNNAFSHNTVQGSATYYYYNTLRENATFVYRSFVSSDTQTDSRCEKSKKKKPLNNPTNEAWRDIV